MTHQRKEGVGDLNSRSLRFAKKAISIGERIREEEPAMFGSLSMTEILVVLAIALIIFGPRRLPQLGRSLGESLAQFRRASEDFKRTWEQEIAVEEKRLNPPGPSINTPSSQKPLASESKEERAADSQKGLASESKN